MLIIPAIDIKDGQCVRLYKGDYNQTTVYNHDPLEVAKSFYDQGAELIHIIDLDGAKTGELVNFTLIENIKNEIPVDIEVGGGIRNKVSIKKLYDAGIQRIIIGTPIIENIAFLDTVQDYLPYIILSMDLWDGKVRTRGWQQDTDIIYQDLLTSVLGYGIKEAIITDIRVDGTLQGPNIELYNQITDEFPDLQVIVSGGISSLENIREIIKLNKPGIQGIITGKAIYEKTIDLRQAIELVK